MNAQLSAKRQAVIGLSLTAVLIGCWLALHIGAIFFIPLSGRAVLLAPALIAVICWLNVGLFIIAHDAMHGSLAPGHATINRALGTLALALYAGFSFKRLRTKHFEHHRYPGSDKDPDFGRGEGRAFWRWYGDFFLQYFSVRELLLLALWIAVYLLAGAPPLNLVLFWAVPALLSSLQLFAFGTFLPHRKSAGGFADHHNARSHRWGSLVSLLTCFHFGHHLEHHRWPSVPWWGLPKLRLSQAAAR